MNRRAFLQGFTALPLLGFLGIVPDRRKVHRFKHAPIYLNGKKMAEIESGEYTTTPADWSTHVLERLREYEQEGFITFARDYRVEVRMIGPKRFQAMFDDLRLRPT